MTLIVTELSSFGIAMVADSAITITETLPSGAQVCHVLNGAQKLQIITYLNAGISVWGLGGIPFNHGTVSTDVWLQDFIQRHSELDSLSAFANCLVQELKDAVGNSKDPIGFHLAGFVDVENRKLPTFYHIRNVDGTYEKYDLHEFIRGQDFPPRQMGSGEFHLTRNGDYGAYAILSQAVMDTLPGLSVRTGIDIPYPSLDGRIAYHSAWVKFVSDLYGSSGLLRTIGGTVAALAIYPSGQIEYFHDK